MNAIIALIFRSIGEIDRLHSEYVDNTARSGDNPVNTVDNFAKTSFVAELCSLVMDSINGQYLDIADLSSIGTRLY